MEVIFLGMHSRDNHLRRCESHCQAAGPRLEVGSGLTDIEMFFASVLLSRTESRWKAVHVRGSRPPLCFADRDRANNWWYPAVRIDSNIDIMDSEG